jgi:hypothetical protein
MEKHLSEILVGTIAIPWIVWTSTSIFSQKQEIALMRQSHDDIKRLIATLIDVLKNEK